MRDIEALRAWHRAQTGTKESPAYSNNVRYNTDYYGRAVSGSAYPWCVVYQWDGFRECGLSELFYGGKKTASCSALMAYAKSHGQWVTEDYREGDLVLFDFTEKRASPSHIGWVDRLIGSTVYTYEGNTSASDDANGGRVEARVRRLGQIVGAFRPAYDCREQETPENKEDKVTDQTNTVSYKTDAARQRVSVSLPTLRQGMKGSDVKILQLAVTAMGFDCGGADGDFGKNTKAAVSSFQSSRGLVSDGVAGVKTWSALFGA